MSKYESTVTLTYTSTYTPSLSPYISDDDFLPQENITMEVPASDLNTRQYFQLFNKFLLAVGMDPSSIRSGAMSLVFNDWVNESEQRKVCDEFELTMNEDLEKKFAEWKPQAQTEEQVAEGLREAFRQAVREGVVTPQSIQRRSS